MRAARLLHMLLLLQNRGRMTSASLAQVLEVSRRTILRDLDAMTEAGLPVIVHRGRDGGIELGFDYRTRLTGLNTDEAEAMGLLLSQPLDRLQGFGLADAADRARSKIWEAFPDQTRATMALARDRFRIEAGKAVSDPRPGALAQAVRQGCKVFLQAQGVGWRPVHPVGLRLTQDGWVLRDALSYSDIAEADWGDVNVSAQRFAG